MKYIEDLHVAIIFISVVGIKRWDRIGNKEIRRWAGIEETVAEKVDRRVFYGGLDTWKGWTEVLARKGQSS